MISGSFNTFMSQIACKSGWGSTAPHTTRSAQTTGGGDLVSSRENCMGEFSLSSYAIPPLKMEV
tara:strand:+ start:39 stop:230 length:192 start_codon:yes stop_codon:yes gene_type:complete